MARQRELTEPTKANLAKCREAAIAAVDSYNRPGRLFRTALFVVLIIMAWLAFFHAYFYKQGNGPVYTKTTGKDKGSCSKHTSNDDEDLKHWGFTECLNKYFRNENPPVRENLRFLFELRNQIEHSYLPELDLELYPQCQAALMNLEEFLVKDFGSEYGLEESLSLSLQFSRPKKCPPEKREAIATLARSAETVQDYIKQFESGLSDQTLNDSSYAFRVFLVPKIVNRGNSADATVEFVHFDSSDKEQMRDLEKLNVLIKEKQVPVPVINSDKKKPSHVVKEVSQALPFMFTMHHHTSAWKHFKVRPEKNSENPEKTEERYCIYDSAHKDYLYTQDWIDKLIRELSCEDRFLDIIRKQPKSK